MKPNNNVWLEKAEKLALLAEAECGTPKGYSALLKLNRMFTNHPETRKRTLSKRTLLEIEIELAVVQEAEKAPVETNDKRVGALANAYIKRLFLNGRRSKRSVRVVR